MKFKITSRLTAAFIAVNLIFTGIILTTSDVFIKAFSLAGMMLVGIGYAYGVRLLQKHTLQLEHKTKHDALTGLLNRNSFNELLSTIIANEELKYLSVFLMDLNKFKLVNDTLGHPVGDELLKQVAARLKKALRTHDYIARLGGDEFAIIVTQYENENNLITILGRLLKCFEIPFSLDSHMTEIGCSIGVSIFPEHGTTSSDLIKRADVAMYTAKNEHLGFFIYDRERDASSFEALSLRADLRKAVEAGDLKLFYQPKKSLITGKLEGIEALARWTHESLGDIPPSTFIPIAEQTGLIRPLTNWVLFRAIEDFSSLCKLGVLSNVSVNISPYSLSQGDLILHVSKELARNQMDPANLILEVTETALHQGTDEFVKVLLCLDLLGLSISIDDFGVGQSSLVYLKSLPVKEIKIDRSFVANMKDKKHDYAIIQHIITLAHSVGCSVCAEGVEDRETEDLLRDIGCDLIQGYLIAKPMPLDELRKFLGVVDRDPI